MVRGLSPGRYPDVGICMEIRVTIMLKVVVTKGAAWLKRYRKEFVSGIIYKAEQSGQVC
jgi:hypothetical protein